MLGVGALEPIEHQRRLGHHRAGSLVVGVEGAQRVGVDPLADVPGELAFVGAEMGAQVFEIPLARAGRAEAREPQPQLGNADRPQQLVEEHDRLGVGERRVGADRLHADLVELAKAPRLRCLVAEERPPIPEPHRLGKLVHPVLDVGAADRRRALRTQGDAAPALVLEGEHLLADDVGRLADAAGEQLGVLEDRRVDPPISGPRQDPGGGALDPVAELRLLGKDVEGPLGSLELGGHRPASLMRGTAIGPARRGTDSSPSQRRAW
jgi:hypothetical protein